MLTQAMAGEGARERLSDRIKDRIVNPDFTWNMELWNLGTPERSAGFERRRHLEPWNLGTLELWNAAGL